MNAIRNYNTTVICARSLRLTCEILETADKNITAELGKKFFFVSPLSEKRYKC